MEAIETVTVADLIARKKAVRDRLDELNSEKSALQDEDATIDAAILKHMDAMGMTGEGAKLSDSGMTVTRRTKWRASVLAEHRAAVMKWCVETGREYLFHARVTDSKVMELVDNGVALPEGLNVQSMTDIDFRRSS